MHTVIVIAGPTSVGKTSLSIDLAQALNGEVVSADSRQVYRGLSIGSGKVKKREMRGVPHHLLDVADPKKTYSAAEYVRDGRKAISDIISRGKVPIIVGGTGFYIDSLLGLVTLPEVSPNPSLRKNLSKKTLPWLQARLKKLDPARYKSIDIQNPVRLVRAIEIAEALGKVPKKKSKPLYDTLYVGLTLPQPELEKRIALRLRERLKEGMLREAKTLRKRGVTWKRMIELGLEYRYMALHLQGKLTREKFIAELEREIVRYAKRQMTWFKKNKTIQWFKPTDRAKVTSLSKKFLSTTS